MDLHDALNAIQQMANAFKAFKNAEECLSVIIAAEQRHNELATLTAEREQQATAAQEKLAELVEQRRNLDFDVTSLSHTKATLDREITEREKVLTLVREAERKLPDLERQIVSLETEFEQRKTDLNRDIAQLTGQKAEIANELEEWQGKLRQFKERFADI